MLKVGDMAPDFTAAASAGGTITLKQFRGNTVVLYFYPKDDTPGCTQEACDFRDSLTRLQRKGSVVLGVSPDSIASHEKFGAKYELPFPLVSDPTHAIAQAYGIWVEKSLHGRKNMGIERTTFVIDATGRIAHIFAKVKVAGHVDEVLKVLQQAVGPGGTP